MNLVVEPMPPAGAPVRLTPRQDRIERALARLLRRDATRSELREVVYQYADLHRLQGLAEERAVGQLESLLRGTLAEMGPRHDDTAQPVTDDAAARIPLILHWYRRRFHRAEVRPG